MSITYIAGSGTGRSTTLAVGILCCAIASPATGLAHVKAQDLIHASIDPTLIPRNASVSLVWRS